MVDFLYCMDQYQKVEHKHHFEALGECLNSNLLLYHVGQVYNLFYLYMDTNRAMYYPKNYAKPINHVLIHERVHILPYNYRYQQLYILF